MTVEELNVKVTADISDLKRDLARMEGAVKGSAKKSEGAMSAGMKKIGGAIAAAFSVQAVIGFSRAVIQVRSEFEKFEAVLTNTLGSSGAAKLALLDIKDMAARTPFSVAELSGAFVKLTNYGLQPSMEAMRQYGDLASSVGKGFDQLAEAVADATTGEFERLKEFGIKASKQGDKVTFTFKEQATTVDFTTKAIENYVKGLGDMRGVSGSMAAISETLGGKVSNLGDKWDSLLNTVGNTDVWGDAIEAMGEALSRTEKLFKVANDLSKGRGIYGTFDAYREAYMLALYDLVGVDWLDESVKKIDEASKKAAESLARAQRMANERRGAGLPGVGPLPQGAQVPPVFGPTGEPFEKVRKSADQLAKELAKATEEQAKLRRERMKSAMRQKDMQKAIEKGQRQAAAFNLRLRGQMDTGGFVKPTITGPAIQYEDTSNLVLAQLNERTFEADEAMFDFGSSAGILSQSLVAAAEDTENASDIFANAIGSIVSELLTQALATKMGSFASFAGPLGGLVGGFLTLGLKGRDLETSRARTRNSIARYN